MRELSVFIPTHIIDVNTNPYIKNEMIFKTILSADYRLLGSADEIKYFVYPDAKFKRTHPELMDTYLMILIQAMVLLVKIETKIKKKLIE